MTRPPEIRTAVVVEDHYLLAIDIEQTLREEGFNEVVTVATLSAALIALDGCSPDLVTIDITLLDHDSEPLETLLAARGTPFIYITGYQRHDRGHDEAPWLVKPCKPSDIKDALAATNAMSAHA